VSRFLVIAGGGTAGHVSPGLAVAAAVVSRGHEPTEILWVGSERGIERDLVPSAGFDLTTVSGRGVPRRHPVEAVRAVASIVKGIFESLLLLRRERPRVVLAMGGFASVACAIAARVLRIPVVVQEQNAVPGAANRMVARWARVCAVSYPGTDLPRAVLTGNPVRAEILAAGRDRRLEARARLDVAQEATMVVITGGSLGALRINRAVVGALPALSHHANLVVHHIVGERDWDIVVDSLPDGSSMPDYRPVRYEHDMATVLSAADLVVSRAGGNISAEIAVMGLASVLVPLPGAPGDHQTRNAQALVDAGAAVIVPDRECTAERLASEVGRLVERNDKLTMMGERASRLGRRDAAAAVARLLEENAT
jgi:undecaprenyldiphospho-muramoylpentapeptide beta-N-acetylglucosaminyltransferase